MPEDNPSNQTESTPMAERMNIRRAMGCNDKPPEEKDGQQPIDTFGDSPNAPQTTSQSRNVPSSDQSRSSDQIRSSEAAEGQTTTPIKSILKKARAPMATRPTVPPPPPPDKAATTSIPTPTATTPSFKGKGLNSVKFIDVGPLQQHSKGERGEKGLLARAVQKIAEIFGRPPSPQPTVTPKMATKLQHEEIKHSQRQAQGLGGKESKVAAKERVEKTSESRSHVDRLNSSSKETGRTRG